MNLVLHWKPSRWKDVHGALVDSDSVKIMFYSAWVAPTNQRVCMDSENVVQTAKVDSGSPYVTISKTRARAMLGFDCFDEIIDSNGSCAKAASWNAKVIKYTSPGIKPTEDQPQGVLLPEATVHVVDDNEVRLEVPKLEVFVVERDEFLLGMNFIRRFDMHLQGLRCTTYMGTSERWHIEIPINRRDRLAEFQEGFSLRVRSVCIPNAADGKLVYEFDATGGEARGIRQRASKLIDESFPGEFGEPRLSPLVVD